MLTSFLKDPVLFYASKALFIEGEKGIFNNLLQVFLLGIFDVHEATLDFYET